MSVNAFSGLQLAPRSALQTLSNNGVVTFAMATLNNCWAARFQATDTRNIYGGYLYWSTVSAPGQVSVSIEPDNTPATPVGYPSGTPYDANAIKTGLVPVAGWQSFTFSTPPSTGLIAGNFYYLVVITTTGGTTQTLGSHVATSAMPCAALTAANGSTRSSLAETANSTPVMTLSLSDGTETSYGGLGYAVGTFAGIYGTRGVGFAFTVPNGETWSVAGIELDIVFKSGSPSYALKGSIYSGSSIVTGATATAATATIANLTSGRNLRIVFPAPVSLAAGNYRFIIEDPAHSSTVSNFFEFKYLTARSSAIVPANFTLAGSSNVTAGPITWDLDDATATSQVTGSIMLDNVTASGGGLLYLAGMTGGME